MSYVSTVTLPPAEDVQALVDDAHARFARSTTAGRRDVYPALARVPPTSSGSASSESAGASSRVGDAEVEFTIMSVAKPFVFALICAALGPEDVRRRIGRERHGLAVQLADGDRAGRRAADEPDGELRSDRHDEPHAGRHDGRAMAVRRRWPVALRGQATLARRGGPRSARTTNHPNRAHRAAAARAADGSQAIRPRRSTCTRDRAAVAVTARDLAMMGATLGVGGVNPITREQVASAAACRHALAVMTTAGLYETSGAGCTTSGSRGRAGSAAGSSPSHRARAGSGPSRRRSTRQETASRDNSSRGSSRGSSGSISSPRRPRREFNGARRPKIAAYWPKRREEMGMSVPLADSELKARHRAMWGSGDYPLMVETFLLPVGERLVEACRHRARDARARRRGRNGQRLAARRASRRRGHRQRPDARAARGRPRGRRGRGSRARVGRGRRREPAVRGRVLRRRHVLDRRHVRAPPSGRGRRARPRLPPRRDDRPAELDARGHARRALRHDEAVRTAAATWCPVPAALGRRGPPARASSATGWSSARSSGTSSRSPRSRRRGEYGEHFKAYYGPTIAARANAEREGRAAEFDEALDAFCDEWNRGTPDEARFEQEYLVAVGTRV